MPLSNEAKSGWAPTVNPDFNGGKRYFQCFNGQGEVESSEALTVNESQTNK